MVKALQARRATQAGYVRGLIVGRLVKSPGYIH